MSYDKCKKGKTYYSIVTYSDCYIYKSFACADNHYDEVLANEDENAVMFKVRVAKTPKDFKREMELYFKREAFYKKHKILKRIHDTYRNVYCWIYRKIYWFLYDRGFIK